jgi:hypothetical protein
MQVSVLVDDQFQKVDFDFLKVAFCQEGYNRVSQPGDNGVNDFIKGMWLHFSGGEALFLEGWDMKKWIELKKSLVFQMNTLNQRA